jgi:hypothetical protein
MSEETGLPEDPSTWPLWQELSPHAFQLLDHALSGLQPDLLAGHETDVGASARLAARYLAATASYGQAMERLEQVLALARRTIADDHPGTLTARHEVARMVAEQGRLGEAEVAFREVLAATVRVLGGDHPSTLVTKRSLEKLLLRRDEPA